VTSGYIAVLFIAIGPELAPFLALTLTLDIADPLVITPRFYLHHVEVVDQDPACGSL